MAQEKAHARVHDMPGAPAVPAPGPTVPVHALLAALAPPIPFQRAFTRSRLRTTAGEGSAAGLLIQPQSSDPTAGGPRAGHGLSLLLSFGHRRARPGNMLSGCLQSSSERRSREHAKDNQCSCIKSHLSSQQVICENVDVVIVLTALVQKMMKRLFRLFSRSCPKA